MIRTLLLVSVLTVSATCAAGQSVTVRSGEHGDFTRLVLSVPTDTSWALSHRKNGAHLSVEIDDVVFETKSVFARLSDQRLESLSQAAPGEPLVLEFGCDCAATAFLHKNTMIVVDIAPQVSLPPLTDKIPMPALSETPQHRKPAVVDPLNGIAEPLLRLDRQHLQDSLMLRVLQGADREVVDLGLSRPGPRASVTVSLPNGPLDLPAHIEVSSILDELGALGEPPLQPLEPRRSCISDAELGFETWSDGRPFAAQVADLRTALYQEFDRLEPGVAVRLAKLMTQSGFGAEAIQVLQLFDHGSPDADRVQTIALIVDDQRPPSSNPFREQQGCDGDSALWAVLADGQLKEGSRQNRIEQSFLRLPDHLRRSLGPRLADIFVGANELEAARRVLRSVDRVETLNQPAATLARAGLATAEGDQETSDTLLNGVINDASAEIEAPLALARLIENRWIERGTVTKRQIDLIAGYALELRNSEMGPVMARGHAVALSLGNEFSPAFGLLQTHQSDRAWIGTRNRVLQMLAEQADDLTFLRYATALKSFELESISVDTALSLAQRFADLGFAAQARTLADKGGDRTRKRERSIVLARAALLGNQPRQALLELDQIQSDPAQRLRAQSFTHLGDYASAIETWNDIGEGDIAVRLSWLAGLTLDEADPSDARLGEMVELSKTLSAPISRVPDKPLSDAAGLLETSIEGRQQIADLLKLATGTD